MTEARSSACTVMAETQGPAAVRPKARSDASVKPSEEAVPSNVENARNLCIGNLAAAATNTDVSEFFKEYLVESSSVPINRHPNRRHNQVAPEVSTEPETPITTALRHDSIGRKTSTTDPSLACWFFKRYGLQGCNGDSCEFKGWAEVRRVKEHCYRRHPPLPVCLRCHEIFATAEEVKEHLKSAVACEPTSTLHPGHQARLTIAQYTDLKKRKRKGRTTEFNEWNETYKRLFPDQLVIPSPYVNVDQGEAGVNPYFQEYVRIHLSAELYGIFKDAAPQNLADPTFFAKKADEAVSKVTANYKRRRTTTDDNDVTAHLKAVSGDEAAPPNCDKIVARNGMRDHPPIHDHQSPYTGSQLYQKPGEPFRVPQESLSSVSMDASTMDIQTPHTQSGRAAADLSTLAAVDDPYAFLQTFDTAFLIDDHGITPGRSWRETAKALESITLIHTEHDNDGIDIDFFRVPAKSSHEQLVLRSTKPQSKSSIGARLNQILASYVQRFQQIGTTPLKPLNTIVISDSEPGDDVKSVLLRAAEKLARLDTPDWQVGIQFFRADLSDRCLLPDNAPHQPDQQEPLEDRDLNPSGSDLVGESFDELFHFDAVEYPHDPLLFSQQTIEGSWFDIQGEGD